MLDATLDDAALGALADRLARADARVRAAIAAALPAEGAVVQAIARDVVHVITGRLRDSLTAVGPFAVAAGTLEERVVTDVPYAAEEAARGPAHDFAQRTATEYARGPADAAAARLAAAILAALEGAR